MAAVEDNVSFLLAPLWRELELDRALWFARERQTKSLRPAVAFKVIG